MGVVETFGKYIEKLCESEHKKAAAFLLKTGWRLQSFRFAHMPDKRLSEADKYLAAFMMKAMARPLIDPEHSAMVSIFTPCEIIMEAGFSPYNVEGFSSYISGSKAELSCIRKAESLGIPETLCSYHRTFLGANGFGILPKPAFIVYTNLICDANMLTFKYLKDSFNVPAYFLDVPADQSEDALDHVEAQLRGLPAFIKEVSGASISEEHLIDRVKKSRQTMLDYVSFLKQRSDRFVPSDIVSPMYCGMSNNILLGSDEESHFTKLLLKVVKEAPKKRGKHIYFMHTIPFWPDAMKERMLFKDEVQIVGDELGFMCDPDYDTENPYRAMAYRMVYNHGNGPIVRRIEKGIEKAKLCKADGVVWFNHWGCKHTLGGSSIAKRRFEEAGFPTLVLDGDGCDSGFGGEGQMATRIGAFLEILGEKS